MSERLKTSILAAIFTCAILLLAYLSYGLFTTVVISGGFAVGLILWLMYPNAVPYDAVKIPFWLTMIAFIALHKTEEVVLKLQERLSTITGAEAPAPSSPVLIALAILSISGWLFIPLAMKRRVLFGTFLAWTFFASMGITELAHFAFPLFEEGSYSFFPGMASVVVLAPLAWWGLVRMHSQKYSPNR